MRQGRQDATVVAKYNERMHQARHGPVFPNMEAKRKWQATPRDKEEYFILSPVSMCSGFPTASLDIHFHRAGWQPFLWSTAFTHSLLWFRIVCRPRNKENEEDIRDRVNRKEDEGSVAKA